MEASGSTSQSATSDERDGTVEVPGQGQEHVDCPAPAPQHVDGSDCNIFAILRRCEGREEIVVPLEDRYQRMLNNSVFQLYCCQGTTREVDIVFFHGLQRESFEDAFWKTWRSRDSQVVWPKHYLSQTRPRARILSIRYNTNAFSSPQETRPTDLTQILIQDMIYDDQVGVGQTCPVILVGHSLGGIFIKKLILRCDKIVQLVRTPNQEELDKLQRFLTNCKGSIFFSSPFLGSSIADLVDKLPMSGLCYPLNRPMIKLLKNASNQAQKISQYFQTRRQVHKMQSYSFSENYKTQFGCFQGRIVDHYSANWDSDGQCSVQANHIDICKMENFTCPEYRQFIEFLDRILPP